MKLGILDPRTLDAGFQNQDDYERAVREISKPSWRTKFVKAISPSTHKAKVSDTLTNLLYETAYNNLNDGEPDKNLFLKCFEQGAELLYLDTKTLGTLLKVDAPEIKPYIKEILNTAITKDAFAQASFNVRKENDIAREIAHENPETPYEPRTIEDNDIKQAQGATVIALFNGQYDDDGTMNPTVANYLREAIAENNLDMSDTFADTYRFSIGYQCNATIAKDFLSICNQPNALSNARAKDKTVEKEFLEVCINSGMNGAHLTETICNANQNIYSYGIELADSAFKAGASPTTLLTRCRDWYRFRDEDGAITKNLVENGADVYEVCRKITTRGTPNQTQFDALWSADPIKTNLLLVDDSINSGDTEKIDTVLGMIETKGAEPNFNLAHDDDNYYLRDSQKLYPYSEKALDALERQGKLEHCGAFGDVRQEMLAYALRKENFDGVDKLLKKGATINSGVFRKMEYDRFEDGQSFFNSIAHLVNKHDYRPTDADKYAFKYDSKISQLFRNIETKDRLEERLQPKEQIHRPVAKKRQGQTWKI